MKKPVFIEDANKLFANKHAMDILEREEKVLIKKLEPFVEPGKPIALFDGEIYQHTQKNEKIIYRKQLLKFLTLRFGKEVANAVDFHCTVQTITAKRLHVKLFE
jgi:hypothetical protein